MSSIRCGKCKGTHTNVASVRACFAGKIQPDVHAPVGAQTWPARLQNQNDPTADEHERIAAQTGDYQRFESEQPHAARIARQVKKVSPREYVGEGFYQKNDKIFKVQQSLNSTRRYAKVLEVEEGAEKGTWVYTAGAISQLREEDKLTEAAAKEFGKLYGVCCICGRTLTNEVSIAAGIGPICSGKMDW